MENQIILNPRIASELENILNDLRNQIDAHCIVLTDTSGVTLAAYQKDDMIQIESLAALIGGHMGVVSKIAHTILEPDGFEFNLHEGKNYAIVIAKIVNTFLLGLAYHRSFPTGRVRMLMLQAGDELAQLAEQFKQELDTLKIKKLNKNFSTRVAKQFDKLIPKKIANEFQIDLSDSTL